MHTALPKIPGSWWNWCHVFPHHGAIHLLPSVTLSHLHAASVELASQMCWLLGHISVHRMLRQPELGRGLLVPDIVTFQSDGGHSDLGNLQCSSFWNFLQKEIQSRLWALEPFLLMSRFEFYSDIVSWLSLVCLPKSTAVSGFYHRWWIKVSQHLKDDKRKRKTPKDRVPLQEFYFIILQYMYKLLFVCFPPKRK